MLFCALFERRGEGRDARKNTFERYMRTNQHAEKKVAHGITFGAFGVPRGSLLVPLGIPWGSWGTLRHRGAWMRKGLRGPEFFGGPFERTVAAPFRRVLVLFLYLFL